MLKSLTPILWETANNFDIKKRPFTYIRWCSKYLKYLSILKLQIKFKNKIWGGPKTVIISHRR